VHPAAEIAVIGWPESGVEMIVHQAKRQDPHGMAKRCLGAEFEKGLEILVLVEDCRPGVAPIENVITVAPTAARDVRGIEEVQVDSESIDGEHPLCYAEPGKI
jgi:hypothetical protein